MTAGSGSPARRLSLALPEKPAVPVGLSSPPGQLQHAGNPPGRSSATRPRQHRGGTAPAAPAPPDTLYPPPRSHSGGLEQLPGPGEDGDKDGNAAQSHRSSLPACRGAPAHQPAALRSHKPAYYLLSKGDEVCLTFASLIGSPSSLFSAPFAAPPLSCSADLDGERKLLNVNSTFYLHSQKKAEVIFPER